MKVTRQWLNEFIPLESVSTQTLIDTLNKTGFEVAGTQTLSFPEGVVIGYVQSREKHPDADKLSICQVDIGTQTLQIVCGAKNVAQGQYIAVATVGATLPNGLTIKDASLRGVASSGMICSTTEIGLPSIDDGIWVLDDSLGSMVCGAPLSTLEMLQDEIIEIELTANRGDCLSIVGIARELSASLNLPFKELTFPKDEEHSKGIGRVMTLTCSPDLVSDLLYRVADNTQFTLPAIISLRLALVGEPIGSTMVERACTYTTHATGVIIRSYKASLFVNENEKLAFICEQSHGIDTVRSHLAESTCHTLVGISQDPSCKADDQDALIVFEASYIYPDVVSQLVFDHNLASDKLFYRSSRGSEYNLDFGMNYLSSVVTKIPSFQFYGGSLSHVMGREQYTTKISLQEIAAITGTVFDKNYFITLLKRLGFDVSVSGDEFVMTIPFYRQDIKNGHDIAEEIVRMVGIDNIPSLPLSFTEKVRTNNASVRYYAFRKLRQKSVQAGFFECVHFIFDERKTVEKLGFMTLDPALDLINPITQELDTLRTSLLPNLLLSAKRNLANSYKKVPLFELGSVYTAQREEYPSMAFLWAGNESDDTIFNHGKPQDITFQEFFLKVTSIIGTCQLLPFENVPSFLHPYQSAQISQGDQIIGFIGRMHPKLCEELDLPTTCVAQIDPLCVIERKIVANSVSKFQKAVKDLTLLVPKAMTYHTIIEALSQVPQPLVEKYYPIDDYTGKDASDVHSLTIRFHLRATDRTLTEDESSSVMKSIETHLDTTLGIRRG